MTNRVILGAFNGTYVLRVSKPGYDVLTPSLTKEQLVFDSRWASTSSVFMSGTIAHDGATTLYTVAFGTTLSVRPAAFLISDAPGNWSGSTIFSHVYTHKMDINIILPYAASIKYFVMRNP